MKLEALLRLCALITLAHATIVKTTQDQSKNPMASAYQTEKKADTVTQETNSLRGVPAVSHQPEVVKTMLEADHHATSTEERAATSSAADEPTNAAPKAAVPNSIPEMFSVKHKKKAGEGYLKGSPLYEEYRDRYSWWARMRRGAGFAVRLWKPVIASTLSWALITLLVAYLYIKNKPMQRSEPFRDRNWMYGVFDFKDFKEDMGICFMALCCPIVRWADTVSSEKVTPGQNMYWWFILMMIFLVSLGAITGGISDILILIIAIWKRRDIRAAYGMAQGNQSLVGDCLLWSCCSCCAIAQEARQVEKVNPMPRVKSQSKA